MTKQRTYLDWNATAPLRAEARMAMMAAFDVLGNPASPHAEGRRARGLIEEAREQVAACLGAVPRNVYFTSGATEAANWLLAPRFALASGAVRADLLLAGATEHACVLSGHRFAEGCLERIPVGAEGRADLAWLERRLGEIARQPGGAPPMIAVQAANNETGVLQPIERIGELAGAAGGIFVCDAVQAAGRVPLDIQAIRHGALFISGHKLGGPKGVGAVVFSDEGIQPEPLVRGGGQERRQRSGTENVAGICGLAAALAAAISERETAAARALLLQRRFEQGLRRIRPDTVVFGEAAPRLGNTTAFAIPGIAAETALIALDLDGVAVSSGSACSSGKVARSHVLDAMGVDPALAGSALRVSTGRTTSEAHIDTCLEALERIARRFSARSSNPGGPKEGRRRVA